MALKHAFKKQQRIRRHKRVRAKVSGTLKRPRISIFRSNCHIWVQAINDSEGKTIAAVTDRDMKSGKTKCANVSAGEKVGALLAEKAGKLGVTQAVFDRGGYKYHGIVRAVVEGARKGGLKI